MKKQTKKKIGANAGFTLVEMMITVVVFTVGLVGILGGVAAMVQYQKFSDYDAITAHWMSMILDEVEWDEEYSGSADPSTLTDDFTSIYVDNQNPFDGPLDITVEGLGAPTQVTLELADATSTANPIEVQITMEVHPNGVGNGSVLTYTTSRMITY